MDNQRMSSQSTAPLASPASSQAPPAPSVLFPGFVEVGNAMYLHEDSHLLLHLIRLNKSSRGRKYKFLVVDPDTRLHEAARLVCEARGVKFPLYDVLKSAKPDTNWIYYGNDEFWQYVERKPLYLCSGCHKVCFDNFMGQAMLRHFIESPSCESKCRGEQLMCEGVRFSLFARGDCFVLFDIPYPESDEVAGTRIHGFQRRMMQSVHLTKPDVHFNENAMSVPKYIPKQKQTVQKKLGKTKAGGVSKNKNGVHKIPPSPSSTKTKATTSISEDDAEVYEPLHDLDKTDKQILEDIIQSVDADIHELVDEEKTRVTEKIESCMRSYLTNPVLATKLVPFMLLENTAAYIRSLGEDSISEYFRFMLSGIGPTLKVSNTYDIFPMSLTLSNRGGENGWNAEVSLNMKRGEQAPLPFQRGAMTAVDLTFAQACQILVVFDALVNVMLKRVAERRKMPSSLGTLMGTCFEQPACSPEEAEELVLDILRHYIAKWE